ncbi:HAD family hydrolase [Lacticaseibacillus baoqingensis]|uniref:HAD family hydrolase n=1 Tax=Lacticaseibacillus baoqingensis TaxID=2486013 RepID=A0ABW4E9H3_9LACO|nr:HAD family hydrolase [Lacticaseibacillus baoqingensis]
MTAIKLIASDLDHTLLTDAGELPPNFYALIQRVHAAGIHFVAASGRALYTLQPMFAQVQEQMSLIAENGAFVIHDGQEVATQYLAPADVIDLVHYTQAKGSGFPILCAKDRAYIDATAADQESFLSQFFMQYEFVDDLTTLDVPIAKYTVFFPNKETYTAFDPDYQRPLGDRFHVTIGGDYFLDIMHQAVNKGAAIKTLGAKLGVAPAEMVAFGDNLNDTEMLQVVGHSYIVAAATPKLTPYATARIGSNADYAVAKMITNILDNGGKIQ